MRTWLARSTCFLFGCRGFVPRLDISACSLISTLALNASILKMPRNVMQTLAVRLLSLHFLGWAFSILRKSESRVCNRPEPAPRHWSFEVVRLVVIVWHYAATVPAQSLVGACSSDTNFCWTSRIHTQFLNPIARYRTCVELTNVIRCDAQYNEDFFLC